MRKRFLGIAAAILIIGLSAYALLNLLLMRYTSGDVYPKYSSLRTDPHGTKAIYESLSDCCGLRVTRNYEDFYKIKHKTNSTLIFTGTEVPGDRFPATFIHDLESFMRNGGRLVVTYTPSGFVEKAIREVDEEREKEKQQKKEPPKDNQKKESQQKESKEDSEPFGEQMISLSKRWGLKYNEVSWTGFRSAQLTADKNLPKILTWHSPVYFDLTGKDWNVLYEQDGHSVLAERNFGKGSLVIASDSFFLSNEAMLRDRHPDLIAWIIGGKKEVIFDEFHHGVAASPGIAALARKYNLHGLAAGLLLIAGLFVWMSSTSLVPASKTDSDSKKNPISGKDSVSGLANLLRRNVPSQSIFSLCCSEWKKSVAAKKQIDEKRIAKVEETIKQELQRSDRAENPVSSYNRVSQAMKERF